MTAADRQPYLWHWRPMAFVADVPPDAKFWIGVCQWRPYTRGTGLKREVVARVYGYAGDPQPAYDLAADLCRRLNDAGARFDAPPAWLRKQYTVPRPTAASVVRRPRERLTAAQVRAVRQRVMRDRLLPAGFVEGRASAYVRRAGEQLHVIRFQASGAGGRFTVNLGFHFTFAPPVGGHGSRPLRDWHEASCAFGTRLGSFLPEREDTWFDYGTDRAVLAAVLERCATESLGALDRTAENWSDPIVALQTVARPWHGTYPLVRACIHLRRGRWQAAEAELDGAAALHRSDADVRLIGVLRGVGERLAAGDDPAVEPAARLPDWVTA